MISRNIFRWERISCFSTLLGKSHVEENQVKSISKHFDKNYVKSIEFLSLWGTSSQCGKTRNSLSHFFDKNFVKVTILLKNCEGKILKILHFFLNVGHILFLLNLAKVFLFVPCEKCSLTKLLTQYPYILPNCHLQNWIHRFIPICPIFINHWSQKLEKWQTQTISWSSNSSLKQTNSEPDVSLALKSDKYFLISFLCF